MRSLALKSTLLAVGACLLALLVPREVSAYPQWQFTSGAVRCNQCHYAPGGGGMPTGYGRDAIGEELSTFEGNGALLFGAVDLPSWLDLNADLRGAFVAQDQGGPDAPLKAIFPMQADAHVRLKFGDFTIMGIGGLRGQVRDDDVEIPSGSYLPKNEMRFLSREHWVMWNPAAQGPYVRAGRFFAPFGLRLTEHIITTRRDTGFNTFMETYNLSAGYLSNDWEAHVTAFAPDYLQGGNQEMGGAAYYERRLLDETLALAGQGKFSLGDGYKRGIVGAVAKYYVEAANLLLMAEGNLVSWMPDGVDSRLQFSGVFGAAVLPYRGIMITALAERLQTDIGVKNTDTNAATGLLSWFPYPHFEIQLVGRYLKPNGQDPVPTFLAQIHYFL